METDYIHTEFIEAYLEYRERMKENYTIRGPMDFSNTAVVGTVIKYSEKTA